MDSPAACRVQRSSLVVVNDHAPRPADLNLKARLLLLQVTREAFARYMLVIKRALTEAAAKESSRAAGVTADPHGTPALSSEQAAGAKHTLHAMT